MPLLIPDHPRSCTDLRMRALYLANEMSLPSVNPNPFARFALAATPTAAADSISRGASSLHAAPSRPVHSSAAKKIRTVLGSKPGDGQEPPKGLLEKYRYETLAIGILQYYSLLYGTIVQTPRLAAQRPTFSALRTMTMFERSTSVLM